MTVAVRTGLRQGSEAWLDARRGLVTSTDIGVLLGLSPFKCEADLADEKLTGSRTESTLRMRMGTALEDLIADEYSRETGRRVQRVRDLVLHPTIAWAGTSPDRRVVGEKRAVELKWTNSRARFADGLPQDVEAQVAWTLGVLGWPTADVAVLQGGEDVQIFEVAADPALFADLVVVATDFRARLAAGGPFARDGQRVKRDHPFDDGTELIADVALAEAVHSLLATREHRKALEATEETLETAIKARMADAATLTGRDFRVTWKRTRDTEVTDWKSVADGLLRQLPETERTALVGIATTVRPGFRPFRVVAGKE